MEVQIRRDDFGLEVSMIFNDEEVGHITLEKDIRGDEYTIIDANISPRFRGRGLYQRAILKLLKEMPSIKINSVFRSPEAERAWVSLLKKLPSKVKVEKIPLVREKTILYQLSLTEQAKLRIEFSEVKEGEITERCWKGYTQKGMKTMFGKRYPNCVKKKKMNESTPLLFKRIIPNMEETINTVIKSLIKTLSSKKICNYYSTSEDFRDSIMNGAMRILGNEFLVDKNLSDDDSTKIREELLFYMRTKYSGKIFLLYEIMCG